MVRFAFFREPDGAGENTFGRVIANEHGVGLALLVLSRGGVPVVDHVKSALQEDRLRTLPTIVEHLELATLPERDQWRLIGHRLPETKGSGQ